MTLSEFLKIDSRERAMILMAVLLDGMEAETYLESDSPHKGYAAWLAKMQPELRMPYVSSLLRKALTEMRKA